MTNFDDLLMTSRSGEPTNIGLQENDVLSSKQKVGGSSPSAPANSKELTVIDTDCASALNGADTQVLMTNLMTGVQAVAATIRLSRGLTDLVDLVDYDRVAQFKWSAHWTGTAFYAIRCDGKNRVFLHRFLMGAPAGWYVDHRDGNGLNCTRSNMRLEQERAA